MVRRVARWMDETVIARTSTRSAGSGQAP
ncbi:MAG: hypothetical protein RLZZ153_906, partial [Pseudomonadota bacterium]